MSLTGRVLGVIASLLMLAAVVVVGWAIWSPQPVTMSNASADVSLQVTMEPAVRWALTGGLVLLGLLTLGVIVESLRGRPRPRLIELSTGEHQSVLVAPDELQRQVESAALQAERVSEAHASVQGGRRGTLAVDLSISVEPESEIRRVVAAVQERVAVALSSKYGVTLSRKPSIEVRYSGATTREQREATGVTAATSDAAESDEQPRRLAS